MYLDEFSRHALIGIITKSLRPKGMTQPQLAKRAHVTQTTISFTENLSNGVVLPEHYVYERVAIRKRRTSREHLLQILCWGFEAKKDLVDVLLWLYDGQPLTNEEISRYRVLPQESLNMATPKAGDILLDVLLENLQGTLDILREGRSSYMTSGDLSFIDVRDLLSKHNTLLLPGHIMYAGDLPPMWAAKSIDFHRLKQRIERYGMRILLSTTLLERPLGPLERWPVKEALQILLSLATELNEKLFIRLHKGSIPFDSTLRSVSELILGNPIDPREILGLHVRFHDNVPAISQFMNFEANWRSAIAKNVHEQLSGLVSS